MEVDGMGDVPREFPRNNPFLVGKTQKAGNRGKCDRAGKRVP